MNMRPATIKDIPQIVELAKQESFLYSDTEITSPYDDSDFTEYVRLGNVYVVELNDQIAATAWFYLFSDLLYLDGIVVSPDHRGKGMGEHLLREIQELAHTRGFPYIQFQTITGNSAMESLAKKMGYSIGKTMTPWDKELTPPEGNKHSQENK